MDASSSRELRHSRQARATACRSCYERKVRCDVKAIGRPCTTCVSNSTVCELRTRKSYPKRKMATSRASPRETSPRLTGGIIRSNFTGASLDEVAPTPKPLFTLDESSNQSVIGRSDHPINEDSMSLHDSKNIDALTQAIIVDEPGEGHTPVFVGDQQGIGYIIDAMKSGGQPRPQHYFVPRRAASLLQSDDLFFLKAKGCFSLPEQAVSDGLLRCYFKYTHPMFPIIDMGGFLKIYIKDGFKGCNLLLLWSMFSVAGSYVDDDLLAMAGHNSRKEMKRSFYHRAKCLYDNGDEADMIVLTQAALLLGFWFSGPENHTASWHWTGRAISIAQTLGLHRDFKGRQNNMTLSDCRRRLWRRIWWACLFRDRWLSLGMGRPMRINEDDCDIPLPSVKDVTQDVEQSSSEQFQAYAPEELVALSCIWVELIKLSLVLGKILISNYQPRRLRSSSEEIQAYDKAVRATLNKPMLSAGSDLLCDQYNDIFHLHQQAVIIALYRPFLTSDDQNHTPGITPPALAHQKTVSAAAATNIILERMMSVDSIKILGPMIPTLLVPTMHTHLLQSKSENTATKLLAFHRLEFCLLVLQELEHNYPAAGIIRSLFLKAKANMDTTAAGQSQTGEVSREGGTVVEKELDGSIPGSFRSNLEVEDHLDSLLRESFVAYQPMTEHNTDFYSASDADVNFILSGDEFSFSDNTNLSV